jgi:hypothetical protein
MHQECAPLDRIASNRNPTSAFALSRRFLKGESNGTRIVAVADRDSAADHPGDLAARRPQLRFVMRHLAVAITKLALLFFVVKGLTHRTVPVRHAKTRR